MNEIQMSAYERIKSLLNSLNFNKRQSTSSVSEMNSYLNPVDSLKRGQSTSIIFRLSSYHHHMTGDNVSVKSERDELNDSANNAIKIIIPIYIRLIHQIVQQLI